MLLENQKWVIWHNPMREGEYRIDAYEWDIIISFIESVNPGRGDFKKLCDKFKEMGFKIQVPTPMPEMEAILKKWGWGYKTIDDSKFGIVEMYESSQIENIHEFKKLSERSLEK